MDFVPGDVAWVIVAAALVMFMVPGLALFYGGMVRAKNVLAMLMQNMFTLGLMSVLWALVAFSLAFGGTNPLIGHCAFAFLPDSPLVAGPGVARPGPPLLC